MDWNMIFSVGTLTNTINTSTIVILAALGCLMTDQAGMMNIGIDGMMVLGAFAAAIGSWASGSWVVGIGCALLCGLVFGLLYGVFVIGLKSDEFIIGVALNIFAGALTSFLLRTFFGSSGTFHPTEGAVVPLPDVNLGIIGGSPVKLNIMVLIAWVLVALCWILLYRTPMGSWIHASGEHPESLRSAGRRPEGMKYFSSVICGLLCGLSGAYLSLGYLSSFSENMSAERGYVAVACVIFGRSNPVIVFFAALLFGFIEAAGTRMQNVVDPTLTKTFPYIGTILMMILLALRQQIRNKKAARN